MQKFTGTGTFLLKWGSSGNGNGQFNAPSFVALDAGGTVFVSDFANQRLQRFTATGSFLSAWGIMSPWGPTGVAVDVNGNVYVTDNSNHLVRKFACP